jgi:hypothetical protein
VEKIAPKNNGFYQELIALYGTFAIPEKQGLIIDKLRLWNLNTSLRSVQAVRRKERSIRVTKAGKINLKSNKWTRAYCHRKRTITKGSSR